MPDVGSSRDVGIKLRYQVSLVSLLGKHIFVPIIAVSLVCNNTSLIMRTEQLLARAKARDRNTIPELRDS